MTGTLSELALAAFAFVASHFLLSARPLRRLLAGALGERPFRILYSAVALALLAWTIVAFRNAPALDLWGVPAGLRHLPAGAMPFACILLVAGLMAANPTAVGVEGKGLVDKGPKGIFAVTRHPVLWGIGLWALSHLLASGSAGRLILFGALGVLAIGGAFHLDARKEEALGPAWASYKAASSNVPLAAMIGGRARPAWRDIGYAPVALGVALYAALMFLHGPVIGLSPLPL
jgi:uncharacterized membrane protein